MQSGRRVRQCELSPLDTALLLAGILTAGAYFTNSTVSETEIRALADTLYRRVDWRWAQNSRPTLSQGWTPECGFLQYCWEGYSEASILYVLAMASPIHPIPANSYSAWTATYQWANLYGHTFLYGGPLFIHQFSHAWIDFRSIQDKFMCEKSSDYFKNSRQATYIQREYALRNPHSFRGYGENFWGFSASDGPESQQIKINGQNRRFFGYIARGVPDGRRRNHRSFRDACVNRFCAGNITGRDPSLLRALFRGHRRIQAAERIQSYPGSRRIQMLDQRRLLRSRSGYCGTDDRELSLAIDMEANASLSVHRGRTT
jgi:hypothetical protein